MCVCVCVYVEGLEIYVLKGVGFFEFCLELYRYELVFEGKAFHWLVTINVLAFTVAVTCVPVACNDRLCGRC